MNLVREMQRALLPERPEVPDYQIAASMIAADAVGGDYYDVVKAQGRHWLVIGDVSGHGISAGLVMMMVQTALHGALFNAPGAELDPARAMADVNAALRLNLQRIGRNQYVTATLLELRGSTVRYAGLHQDILVYRVRTEQVDVLETRGIWIGLMDDIRETLSNEEFTLSPGDTALLFTDGLTERRENGKMLGISYLVEAFGTLARQEPDVPTIVREILLPFQGEKLDDDMSVIAARYCPVQ